MSDLLAVDVALLLPDAVNEWCGRMNRALLADEPAGFQFDATHLPHVSLVQQFVSEVERDGFSQLLGSFLKDQRPVHLRGVGSERGGSALRLERTGELQRLHEDLMRLSEPFRKIEGGPSAFYGNDELPREADLRWVRRYPTQASFDHFSPHVTLGVGNNAFRIEGLAFVADRVGLCHLGRFGTCRKVLDEWTLKT